MVKCEFSEEAVPAMCRGRVIPSRTRSEGRKDWARGFPDPGTAEGGEDRRTAGVEAQMSKREAGSLRPCR